MDNKQWETEGRCPECERKDTCKKACDAHKKRVRGEKSATADVVSAMAAANIITNGGYIK